MKIPMIKKNDLITTKIAANAALNQITDEKASQNRIRLADLLARLGRPAVLIDSKRYIDTSGKSGCIMPRWAGFKVLCAMKREFCTGPDDCAADMKVILADIEKNHPNGSMMNFNSLLNKYCYNYWNFNRERLIDRWKQKEGGV
jgi:hypothetical protein